MNNPIKRGTAEETFEISYLNRNSTSVTMLSLFHTLKKSNKFPNAIFLYKAVYIIDILGIIINFLNY